MTIVSQLTNKEITIESALKEALKNKAVLSELMAAILSHQEEERYNCFKVLLPLSEEHPNTLYIYWNQLSQMLLSENSNFQSIAIQILANLTNADSDNRFEKLFNSYFQILEGDKTITSAFVANNAWKIALAKPELRAKVTERLLNIDYNHKGKQKDLIKGHAIESFNRYFGEADIEEKKRIIEFVTRETFSKSPRTKKTAKDFLREWE